MNQLGRTVVRDFIKIQPQNTSKPVWPYKLIAITQWDKVIRAVSTPFDLMYELYASWRAL